MANTRRIVLDMMKPHEPRTLTFADAIADLEGVEGVNAMLVETDREVETVKLTIEGDDVDFDAVTDVIDDLGGALHSVDQVVSGSRLVEESHSHQG